MVSSREILRSRSFSKRDSRLNAFTIVELLIVIVIIGILAAVTIVAYNGAQDRANQAKIKSDIRTIVNAIMLARENEGKTLPVITANSYTAGSCVVKPDGTDLATLPSSDPCITNYNNSLNAISNAAGARLNNLRDPWGRPYFIDENEGENTPTNCTKDIVGVFKKPFTTGGPADGFLPQQRVPLSGFTGCS